MLAPTVRAANLRQSLARLGAGELEPLVKPGIAAEAAVHAQFVKDAAERAQDELSTAVALGYASTEPQSCGRMVEHHILTIGPDGKMAHVRSPYEEGSPEERIVETTLAPVVVATVVDRGNDAPLYCYSVRGTKTRNDKLVDVSASRWSRLYSRQEMQKDTGHLWKSCGGAEAQDHMNNTTGCVHRGFRSFGVIVAHMIRKDLRDSGARAGRDGSIEVALFGHSLGAAGAMIAGHILSEIRTAAEPEPIEDQMVRADLAQQLNNVIDDDEWVDVNKDIDDAGDDAFGEVANDLHQHPLAAVNLPVQNPMYKISVRATACPNYAKVAPVTVLSRPHLQRRNLDARCWTSPSDRVLWATKAYTTVSGWHYPMESEKVTTKVGTCSEGGKDDTFAVSHSVFVLNGTAHVNPSMDAFKCNETGWVDESGTAPAPAPDVAEPVDPVEIAEPAPEDGGYDGNDSDYNDDSADLEDGGYDGNDSDDSGALAGGGGGVGGSLRFRWAALVAVTLAGAVFS